MTKTIELLHHGHVRLVECMGSDLSVVRSARISYAAEWRSDDSDAKLIDYLARNHHTSPFECVQFTFDVKAPIFVARQWMRHRTGKYNEVSGRYSVLPQEFYVPEASQITQQSTSNKQMRTDQEHPRAFEIQDDISHQCMKAFETYRKLIAIGTPRELARGVLPLNTFTHFFYTVDLHNLSHFLRLRLHEHSQYEIRVYAQAMLELIEPIVPVSVAALRKHVLV